MFDAICTHDRGTHIDTLSETKPLLSWHVASQHKSKFII